MHIEYAVVVNDRTVYQDRNRTEALRRLAFVIEDIWQDMSGWTVAHYGYKPHADGSLDAGIVPVEVDDVDR